MSDEVKKKTKLCPRVTGEFHGIEVYCDQIVTTQGPDNSLGWCDDCRKRLPIWATGELEDGQGTNKALQDEDSLSSQEVRGPDSSSKSGKFPSSPGEGS